MTSADRVKTGIPGFDELIEGGIPKGFNVLLVGLPGTGKTIFALEYIINGALNGENGIYVSLDSPNEMIKDQARQFGWDVDSLEKEGKITFLKIPLDKPKINLFDMLEEEIKAANAQRLVFDSLADFAINIDQFIIPLAYSGLPSIESPEEQEELKKDKKYRYEVMPTLEQDPRGRIFYKGHSERRISYLVINEMLKLGTTNLIVTDERQGGEHLSVDGVSEYACDGLVRLGTIDTGGRTARTLRVLKMRNSKISMDYRHLEINEIGISIS